MTEEEPQTPRAARSHKRSNQKDTDLRTPNEEVEMAEEEEMQTTQDQNQTTGQIEGHLTEQKQIPLRPLTVEQDQSNEEHAKAENERAAVIKL